jgi:hypothetical protein
VLVEDLEINFHLGRGRVGKALYGILVVRYMHSKSQLTPAITWPWDSQYDLDCKEDVFNSGILTIDAASTILNPSQLDRRHMRMKIKIPLIVS